MHIRLSSTQIAMRKYNKSRYTETTLSIEYRFARKKDYIKGKF